MKADISVQKRSAEAELRALVARFAPSHQRLVAALRRAIRKRLPNACEVAYEYRAWFVISYSPTERGYEGILAIRGSEDGVKLYFSQGKELSDPGRLLHGSAKARSINVDSAAILDRPAVAKLIDEAIALNRVPFAATRGSVMMHSALTRKRRSRPS